jgi:hypothetical protein
LIEELTIVDSERQTATARHSSRNPSIVNPSIVNPSIVNPSIANPSIPNRQSVNRHSAIVNRQCREARTPCRRAQVLAGIAGTADR